LNLARSFLKVIKHEREKRKSNRLTCRFNSDQQTGQQASEQLMQPLSRQKLLDLLGTSEIPGTDEQIQIFCVRLGELLEMNGEHWIRSNHVQLLAEWRYIIEEGIL